MKTRTEYDTDTLRFGYYEPDEDEFIAVENTAEIVEAAEKLDCSAELLTALVTFIDAAKAAIRADLQAIERRNVRG